LSQAPLNVSSPATFSAASTAQPGQAAANAEKAAPQRRNIDGAKAPVLPDCCNPYVLIRVIVPVHLAALLAAWVMAPSPGLIGARLLDILMVLEAPLLGSMLVLCALRKQVNGWPQPAQWLVGMGVPALLTGLVAALMAQFLLPLDSPTPIWFWVAGKMACAALIAALAIELLRLRAKVYSPSLAEARLQALQARIRPHFLFNSLNTVLGLMRSDPRRAELTLENLADLFRVFMKDTRALVPMDEEVVLCQQYLAIEQLRLGERLQVRWNLEQMPSDALLPALLLQPLIENAVHHGIEPRTEPGEIQITCSKPGDRVRVEIVNPVANQPNPRAGNQMALSNVRERLMLLYDMEGKMEASEDNGQFRLWLEIPYRQEKRRRDVRRNIDINS
jgi:two-component system, LytTR family, sensor histidine kinase AlgZ